MGSQPHLRMVRSRNPMAMGRAPGAEQRMTEQSEGMDIDESPPKPTLDTSKDESGGKLDDPKLMGWTEKKGTTNGYADRLDCFRENKCATRAHQAGVPILENKIARNVNKVLVYVREGLQEARIIVISSMNLAIGTMEH